jgi:DNA replication licensing factor MCM3
MFVVDQISEAYADLRTANPNDNTRRTLPVTARSLETLIRLSTAHARARLSNKIEASDCDAAIELLQFALYNDATAKADLDTEENDRRRANATVDNGRRQRRRLDSGQEDSNEQAAEDAEQDMDVEESRDGAMEDDTERFEVFKNAVSSALQEFQENPENENGIRVEDLEARVQTNKLKYRRAEVEDMLRRLETENRLMYSDGLIFPI